VTTSLEPIISGKPAFVKGLPQHQGPAAAWAARAGDLAEWVWRLLINRVDVWGRYRSEDTYTAPAVASRGRVFLTEADVTRHFRPARRGDILGLHTTSPQNQSRWFAIDIDCHGPGGNDPAANLAAALARLLRKIRDRELACQREGKAPSGESLFPPHGARSRGTRPTNPPGSPPT
jgi:hypothetical protein